MKYESLINLYMGEESKGKIMRKIKNKCWAGGIQYLNKFVDEQDILLPALLFVLASVLLIPISAFAQQVPDKTFRPSLENPAFQQGKGPIILIDEGHFNFHTMEGRYFAFTRLLNRDGYTVRPFRGAFTPDSLNDGDILVISNPLSKENARNWKNPIHSAFTKEEIQVVKRWVASGGSLFLVADHMPWPGAVDGLALAFGIKFSNGFVRKDREGRPLNLRWHRDRGELPDHPILKGRFEKERVDIVATGIGSAFRISGDAIPLLVLKSGAISEETESAWEFTPETPVVDVSGWSQGAVLLFGKGRVAVFSEASMFSAQLTGKDKKPMGMNEPEKSGNVQFLLNVIHWLSGLLDQ
jgi:hypothetical protein